VRHSASNQAPLKHCHFILFFFNLLTYSTDKNMRHMFREKKIEIFFCEVIHACKFIKQNVAHANIQIIVSSNTLVIQKNVKDRC